MSESLPAPAEVDAEIRALQLALGASELHGGLCGWLAGGGAALILAASFHLHLK